MNGRSAVDGAADGRPRAMPFIVWGGRAPGRGDTIAVDVEGGAVVTFPRLTPAVVEAVLGVDRTLLVDVPLQEIVSFLKRAGRFWKSDEYARRQLYINQLETVLGYSRAAAEAEADWIGILLDSSARMYDLVAAELGSYSVLEEWLPQQEAYVRAFPRGLVAHILPGNVPLSAVVSLVRALLTKNVSVLKASSSDPITPVFLPLSLLDIDPSHPVARAVTTLYWPHHDDLGRQIVAGADAVCAWGGSDAVEAARAATSAEAAFLAFGPKESFAVLGRDADLDHAARGVAHDVASYDQGACFSTRRVFTETDVDAFVDRLRPLLDEYEELLPPPRRSVDASARIALQRLEHEFLGHRVECGVVSTWTIVVCPATEIPEHPLGRTLYVHPVDAVHDVYGFAAPTVQTIAFLPWDLAVTHRDALARRGVSRFTEVGMSNVFRIGGSHDGLLPLRELVRIVCTDAPARVFGKGMVLQINQTELLRSGSLRSYEL